MNLGNLRDIRILALLCLMLVQGFCALFFLVDITRDIAESRYSALHVSMELLANLTLVAAIVMEGVFFVHLLRRQALADRAISVASGELDRVIREYYHNWGLTPSEADVATFTIKGFAIAEVARMRGSAEGTIKNHLNAVYRKAGVAGRAQLVSLLIEDLLNGRLSGGGAGLSVPTQGEARTGGAERSPDVDTARLLAGD
ncbi:MAG: helix-turn-helix transcriptional regulator [Paracoccaceae bacterium]